MTPEEVRFRAQAELERRRRSRLASFPAYGEWLAMASPEFTWRYAWLRYVQGFYDRVTAGEIRKLMVFAPPQHGKSEGGTIRYPAYRLERDPKLRVIVACHTQALANKFSRKTRKIAKARMPLSKERAAVEEWETAAGGALKAVGVGGSISGTPGDLAFIDDPVKSRQAANSPTVREAVWEWYCDELTTRIQQSGAVVIQMTRWHEDDLAGRILASEDGPNWTVVKLPALAEEGDPLGRAIGEALCPERFSREVLENKRLILRNAFYALFQQTPRPKEGGFFKRAWFDRRIDRSELPAKDIVSWIRWWDRAATEGDGDWTVGVLVAKARNGKVYIVDVVRGQWGQDVRNRRIKETAESDPAGTKQWTEQEPGSSGKDSAQNFVRLLAGISAAKFQPSTGSKEDRADAMAGSAAIGDVILVRAAWNGPFVDELCEFPTGNHDDQVDAASGAYNRAMKGRKWEAT